MSNYGDVLNHLVVEHVTGRRVEWSPLGREDLVAIGSVLIPYLRRGGVGQIWGSGLNEPPSPEMPVEDLRGRVISVRGPLTVEKLGLDVTKTRLGDPGLLVRSIGARRRGPAKGRILIPHYSVFQTRAGRAKLNELRKGGFTIAPPTLTPRQMIDTIAGAEYVASSGLHGLILAQALGTPANLISFGTDPAPTFGFKYRDYIQSVGYEGSLHNWRVLGADPDALRDGAAEHTSAVSSQIDALVAGLMDSAREIA